MADISHLIETINYNTLINNSETNLNFFVVGAGGTGGHLIPNLVRQVSVVNRSLQGSNQHKHTITIMDGDEVEEKNLLRQNFVAPDVNKNKAEVMALRYGRAFGEEVSFVDEYLSTPQSLIDIVMATVTKERPYRKQHIIVIDCTDNNKTRLLIKTAIDSLTGFSRVFLSSGNEEKAGQVVCSFKPKEQTVETSFNDGLRKNIRAKTPDFFDIFPNSPIDKLPGELSCAENAISAPQNIATNTTAANILFSFVVKLLANEGISELAIFFDSSNLSQKTYRAKKSDYLELFRIVPNNAHQTFFLPRSLQNIEEGSTPVSFTTWDKAQQEFKELEAKKLQEAKELLESISVSV